jgi:hypothetical protein
MFDVLPWKRNKDKHAKELRREIGNMYDRFFEAENPFQPRDPLCLLKDQLLDKCDSEFTKGVPAQIVWCKPLNMGFHPR